MRIARMKIGQRLALGFGMAIALMVAVILFGAAKLISIKHDIEVDATERYPQTVLANGVKSDLHDVVQAMRDMLLLEDAEEIKARVADLEQSMAFADKSLGELNRKPSLSAKESDLKKSMNETHADFAAELDSFKQLVIADERDKARDVLYTRVETAQLAYFQSLNNVVAFHEAAMDESSRSAVESASRAVVLMLALAGGACLLAVAIGVLVTRGIVRSLDQAVDLAKRVAEGDLTATIDVKSQDETGILVQNLKAMNQSLERIVAEVRQGTDTISVASAEIAQGNMDLAARTEQQAASVERIVASMDVLTSTVKQNADNAQQARHLADSASDVALRAGAVVNQVVETMQSINESARKIADITSVIDGIAFQTNILALNAAVEAARAGDQGRGFAVVAAEVRNLAQRSAGAAREIKELIGDSVDRANAGSKLVGQAGATMEEVVTSVKRVTDIIGEISSASIEQSTGIVRVNEAFTQIDEATNQNAALVEEAAATAERMREEAAILARAVGVFKLNAAAVQVLETTEAQPAASRRDYPLLT
ncbi:methyl-accepting chemotaxis protein [Noviherbaspirillum sp.]|uniref:methyl-accepting chemotaxis protein n=1 Tax=Noviherbaspirillum sp. TaxID=1926288 RepID=UPI002D4B58D5|nr:methyl-accepting chemotaxis protein [Noviherbaspirillum sp.]HZW19756.1 methyl-accepting chemotaxis protein [Noviherbaspirillum sp.]